MEPLIDVHHETTELVPNLATEWRMISPQEWEFKLREGVPYHKTGRNADDWGEFKAGDVVLIKASKESMEAARTLMSALNDYYKGVCFALTYNDVEFEIHRK